MKAIFVAAAGLLSLTILAACDTGTKSSGSANGGGAAAASSQSAAAGAAMRVPAPQSGADAASSSSAPTDLPQAVIKTADLSIRVENVVGKADRAEQISISYGGEVSGDERSGTGMNSHADLVLLIPNENLDRALAQLAGLGSVTERHTSSDDVTAKVADVHSRVLSMQAAIARLRGLYDHAGTISQILSVEQVLSQRESDLEALEAEQRGLAAQTSMATVNIHLTALTAPAPSKKSTGFTAGLKDGWHAFTATLSWLLAALGAMLPFLVLLAIIGAGALALWRRRTQRPAPAAAPPSE